MNREDLRSHVLAALQQVAPEAELDQLNPTQDLRDQLDIDSMDVLNFAVALHRSLGVEIPDADASKLLTLDGCIDYLSKKTS
jgi:acyl carrier protein